MNWDAIIHIVQIIALGIAAFAWGYEKGRGDEMQDEIDFYEKHLKKKADDDEADETEKDNGATE